MIVTGREGISRSHHLVALGLRVLMMLATVLAVLCLIMARPAVAANPQPAQLLSVPVLEQEVRNSAAAINNQGRQGKSRIDDPGGRAGRGAGGLGQGGRQMLVGEGRRA